MSRFAYSNPLALTLASIIASTLLFPSVTHSQEPEWMQFISGGAVYAIADDGDYLWLGGVGLTRLDKVTGEMVLYNEANSGLPSNSVHALAIDEEGNLWVGTSRGLTRFDGKNWTAYHIDVAIELCFGGPAEPWFPGINVSALTVDGKGNLWVGMWSYPGAESDCGGGLAKFDGESWTVYHWHWLPNACALQIDGEGPSSRLRAKVDRGLLANPICRNGSQRSQSRAQRSEIRHRSLLK